MLKRGNGEKGSSFRAKRSKDPESMEGAVPLKAVKADLSQRGQLKAAPQLDTHSLGDGWGYTG